MVPLEKLYAVAAGNLRVCGIISITPLGLRKAMTLLQLPPYRLVAQGLAPSTLMGDGNSSLRFQVAECGVGDDDLLWAPGVDSSDADWQEKQTRGMRQFKTDVMGMGSQDMGTGQEIMHGADAARILADQDERDSGSQESGASKTQIAQVMGLWITQVGLVVFALETWQNVLCMLL